jgi:peptide/nickel transport system permease protein
MIAYIARRLILAVFTVWTISLLAFIIMELPPGDTADKWYEYESISQISHPSEEEVAAMRAFLGVDKPVMVRYARWASNLMKGQLGMSMQYRSGATMMSVKSLIGDRLFLTIVLSGFTVLVTWTFAIPVGMYSAVRQHSIGDYTFTLLGFTGLAVPDFLLGLVLMYLAFAYFDQSVGGLFSQEYINEPWSMAKAVDLLNHLWIPAAVLGTSGTAGLIRIMRNNLLDELSKPYVVTARAKGLGPVRALLKYPVRVAINPLVSTVGYLLPSLISGSVIVSVVLSLPTMGPLLLVAMQTYDYELGGFIILMLGVLTVLGTLVSDILLAVVDPRIKLTRR